MVGDKVAVGAAEEFVRIAILVHNVAHSAVFEREARLQGTTERRSLRFAHRGVTLYHPYRHKYQSYGRALLSQKVAEELYHADVEVVVLHRVAILVRHELLNPRHRVAVDGGRGEKLHTLG